jgi:hypothetical protein
LKSKTKINKVEHLKNNHSNHKRNLDIEGNLRLDVLPETVEPATPSPNPQKSTKTPPQPNSKTEVFECRNNIRFRLKRSRYHAVSKLKPHPKPCIGGSEKEAKLNLGEEQKILPRDNTPP